MIKSSIVVYKRIAVNKLALLFSTAVNFLFNSDTTHFKLSDSSLSKLFTRFSDVFS